MIRRLAVPLAVAAACAVPPAPAALDPPGLPGFGGSFRGTLRLLGDGGDRTVPMGLDVLPVDDVPGQFTWRLRYGEGEKAQVRDYRLLVRDATAGRYAIDEQNGIVLVARRVDDELVSLFVVDGQLLSVRYRAVPAGVAFALEAIDAAGGQPAGDGVRTIAEFACQRGILARSPAAARP